MGALLAVPFAILAANNIVKNRLVNGIIRFIFMLARTLPTLVLALIATYIFGLGTFAGVVAIFIFTFLLSENNYLKSLKRLIWDHLKRQRPWE